MIKEETIERLKRDNCFDFLRYFFAFSLILVHFCTLTDTEQFWFVSGQMRVKAFFTITGFLVVYSFLRRKSLKVYFWKRVLRILPAYVTTILMCYLVGFFFSSTSFDNYYFSLQSMKYLVANLSFMNFIEPSLPGLFTDNPTGPAVNGSLWSMKLEVLFYVLVPFIIWLIRKFGKLYVLIPLLVVFSLFRIKYNISFNTMIYFFTGTAVLFYFERIFQYIKLLFPATIILIVTIYYFDNDITSFFEPIVFSMLIIEIAYFCKPLNFLQGHDNISYGLYLYHYPVVQVLVQYRMHDYNIYLTFLLTMLFSVSLALVSWYVIEKPLLKMVR